MEKDKKIFERIGSPDKKALYRPVGQEYNPESSEWRTKDPSQRIRTRETSAKTVEQLSEKEDFPLDRAHNVKWSGAIIVVSSIDESPKYSEGYSSCIGLVVVGESKDEPGKNISLMTHHTPQVFFDDNHPPMRELRPALLDFLQKVKPGTVDAVLFGGAISDHEDGRPRHLESYLESIESIGQRLEKILGFDVTVISDPRYRNLGVKAAAFDTDTRQLWPIGRWSSTPLIHEPFPASKVREQQRFEEKWRHTTP